MADPALRVATYQDVLDTSPMLVAELVAGELYVAPRPAAPHAVAASTMGSDIHVRWGRRRSDDGRPGGWHIIFEPELHLGDPDPRSLVLVPDLAGWRRERMPVVPNVAGIALVPDWACEIVSPGRGAHDRVRKMAIYANVGIHHYWIVDPLERTLEVYRLTDGLYAQIQAFADDDEVRAEPFDAVPLDPTEWWPEAPPAAE